MSLDSAGSKAGADRVGALDALRFFAAVFVVLYHFGSSAPIDLTVDNSMLDRGWLATDFFIIVSGYVLGRAYGNALDSLQLSPPRFVLRRLIRIWPAHLIVLAGLAAMIFVAGLIGLPSDSPERFQAADFLQQAFLIHAWGGTHQPSWNEPSWTLSALLVCYVVFPVVWLTTRRLAGRGWALSIGIGLLVSAAILSRRWLGASLYDLPFHQGVLRALPFFIFGALLARFVQNRTVSRANALASCLAAFGALVVIQVPDRSEFGALASIVALATLIVSADRAGLKRTPMIKAAADTSFALFITHAVIGTVWFSGMEALNIETSWLTWIGAWVSVLVGAVAFHLLIDKPIQRYLRDLISRPPRPAATSDIQAA